VDFLEVCRKFIEIDSTPSVGTLEIARYAADLCAQAGFVVELQDETLGGLEQANVLARPTAGLPAEELLLQTHLDTSDPGSYGLWTRTGSNPFNASIYQDTLFGLGTADTKLDFLCKLEAARQVRDAVVERGLTWKLPFVLAGTFGEEHGMQGAVKLIRKKKINAKLALVGEPTELNLVHSGKGFAGVEIEIPFAAEEKEFRAQHDRGDGTTSQSRVFIGKAAHSSSPQMGDSAISKMLDYMTKLPEGLAVMEIEGGTSFNTVPAHAVLEFDIVGALKESIGTKITSIFRAIAEVEKRFRDYPDAAFIPPEPTLNIGQIRSFEDFVKISGCVRLPPTVTDQVYEEWMTILKKACFDMGAVFRVTDYKQPFRTGDQEPLVRICEEELVKLGRSPRSGTQAVANEANVFSRFGVTCVVVGPGQGVGNSHAPNEHVKIKELEDAVRFYRGVIERICL
jgi:acetylornithine deacetylase/succinyl-diaminopimelate desuccinylase-like protein